jgi:hypothetical protein
MNMNEILKEITENYFFEDYYRFDLKLPKKIIGRGKTYELYVAPFDCKPWANGDCKVPLQHVEGAMIKEIISDYVIISFIIDLNNLVPFLQELWQELKEYDYAVELINNGIATMGN